MSASRTVWISSFSFAEQRILAPFAIVVILFARRRLALTQPELRMGTNRRTGHLRGEHDLHRLTDV